MLLRALAVLAVAAPAAAQQGALELFVGETLFVSGTRVALTWLRQEGGELVSGSDGVPNPSGLERDRDVLVASVATNVRRGLDVALVLPWAVASGTFERGGGVLSTDNRGIGDLAIVFKQRVYHEVWNKGAWNAALLGGVETPTGDTSGRTAGALDPPNLQPGSGSWDPFIGLASTYESGRMRLDAQLFWQRFGEGEQDNRPGDVFSAEFDIGYRVLMTRYPGPTLSTKAGMRYRNIGRGQRSGLPLSNSGGEELAALVAAGWHPSPEWDVSFRLEAPLYADWNGTQIATDYRALVGVGIRF